MTDPCMDVVDPPCHGLHRLEIGRHQPLGNTTPMAQVCREPHPWMSLQPHRHLPGVRQAPAAMGLQHHGAGHGIDAVENSPEKTMLDVLRPAVTANDQIDLERFHGQRTTQQRLKLFEMLFRTIGQIWGVAAPSSDLEDQRLPSLTEELPNLRCINPLQTRMNHIAFETIKSVS